MAFPIAAMALRGASASTLRLGAGSILSSGSVSDKINLKEMRAGISEISIDILDKVTPFLAKNKAGKLYSDALKYSLRRTTAHFRKQLSKDIGYKVGANPPKKMLNPDQLERFLERMVYLRQKGVDTQVIKRRHLHQNKRPWQARMKKTITYRRLRKDGLAYSYGFTGRTKSGSISKTAIRYGKAVTEGKFFDKKTGRVSNQVTAGMKRYLGMIGLGTKKSKLDFPARPVVDPFFAKNRNNMIKYMAKRYNEEAMRIQRKADSTKARRMKFRIA